MQVNETAIVGRELELAAVRRFVSEAGRGAASLVLEGLAGIGKTAIWQEAVRQASDDGVAVRACRCSESDAGWAFAGLGDLLDGIDNAILASLPAVQEQALRAALLVAPLSDAAPGDRVMGVAVLGALRALARAGPLLLAIDDVQWLDASSRRVLGFALRRLTSEPVRLLVSCRTGSPVDLGGPPDLGLAGERLLVGPVSIGILQRIVRTRLGETFSRPTLTRLHQASGGNAMISLEMARALQRRGREPAAGEPAPVPADLRVLVTDRLASLGVDTRELLLVTAALAHPTVSALTGAVTDPHTVNSCLAAAIGAGVLELDGDRVRFTHPLMASIPYADLVPGARRHLHHRLAAVVTDPEEHARHAALAIDEPSSSVAAALDVGARAARARGSIDAAAELAELALARTPAADIESLLRRSVEAARYLFLLGDLQKARSLLAGHLAAARPGPSRVHGLLLQGTIASWEHGDATVAGLCDQAITEAGTDPLLLAYCHATLAETSPSGATADLLHAQTAVTLLEAMDEPPADLLANALTNLACNACRTGGGLAVETLLRAVALQDESDPVPLTQRAGLGLGMYLKVADLFDASRTWLLAMHTAAVDEGDDSALPITLGHLATLECWAGNYQQALVYAEEGREHAIRMAIPAPMAQSAHVLALAHRGRTDEARVLGAADLALDEEREFDAAVALHLRSLGVTELFAGNAAAAGSHFLRALDISSQQVGIGEPGILRAHGDAVAALVAAQRMDDADRLTQELEASAAANSHPWSVAMALRCRALVAAATGEGATALAALQASLVAHQSLPMPFEQARTQLLLGIVLRRAGRRTDARAALESAARVFDALGTPVQSREARAELATLGGWADRSGTLTPVEGRIAALVSAGQTNREVAEALFLSVRTVESHLGRIYRKLGVRSRTELASKIT